jgi:hypothetical protein
MNKETQRFNPGSFNGALDESFYAKDVGLGKGTIRRRRRQKLVNIARTRHKADAGAQMLANKLERCRVNHRCKSPACPECGPAAQELFVTTVGASLEDLADGEDIVCVTIVPADGTCRPGKLSLDHARRNIRRWKEDLARAGVTWFVGGLDYSFNEHNTGRYKPHWSEHFFGFTSTANIELLKEKSLAQFPETDAIPRPVKIEEWDGDDRAIRYALKANFWRRVATDTGERYDKKRGGNRRCRDTRKERLRARERVELLIHLDKVGFQGRFIFRWAQFINHGTSTAIVNRKPKAVVAKAVKTRSNGAKSLGLGI